MGGKVASCGRGVPLKERKKNLLVGLTDCQMKMAWQRLTAAYQPAALMMA
jgi:hypothetical protein